MVSSTDEAAGRLPNSERRKPMLANAKPGGAPARNQIAERGAVRGPIGYSCQCDAVSRALLSAISTRRRGRATMERRHRAEASAEAIRDPEVPRDPPQAPGDAG